MHLIDRDPHFIEHAQSKLQDEQSSTQLHFHVGDSVQVLKQLPAHHFDWLYIDGDHSYSGVWGDLVEAQRLVKPEGFIIANDYIFYDHINKEKYGVIEAVNQFCIQYDYEIIYFVLQVQMFCDVVLKKRNPTSD